MRKVRVCPFASKFLPVLHDRSRGYADLAQSLVIGRHPAMEMPPRNFNPGPFSGTPLHLAQRTDLNAQ